MRKVLNILQLIILLILTITGIWYFCVKKTPESLPVISYQYITDTVFVSVPYETPTPYQITTPPITITEYIVDTGITDSMSVIIRDQKIIIIGLQDSILIHENFLKQSPINPKLLAISLQRNLLEVGVLNRFGQVQSNAWPIDLNHWSYNWSFASDLTRHPTQPPPAKENSPVRYFAGGGVDLLRLSPYISGGMEKDYQSIRLYGTIQLGLLDRETSGIKIGIDYRFNE